MPRSLIYFSHLSNFVQKPASSQSSVLPKRVQMARILLANWHSLFIALFCFEADSDNFIRRDMILFLFSFVSSSSWGVDKVMPFNFHHSEIWFWSKKCRTNTHWLKMSYVLGYLFWISSYHPWMIGRSKLCKNSTIIDYKCTLLFNTSSYKKPFL